MKVINPKLQSRTPGRKSALDEIQIKYLLQNYHIATIDEWAQFFDVSEMTIRNIFKRNNLEAK